MRRLTGLSSVAAALVLAAPLFGGCSATWGVIPSPACGGFHLVVANHGTTTVRIRVNGTDVTSVDAAASLDISEWGSPSAGALPWKVEVVDPAGGSVLATRDVTESSGQGAATMEVDAGASGGPAVGSVQPAKGC